MTEEIYNENIGANHGTIQRNAEFMIKYLSLIPFW